MATRNLCLSKKLFSTSISSSALVKSPIQVFGTEGSYASALYSAAHKKKVLEVVEKDLIKFSQILKTDVRLADFLADPSIKKTLKDSGLSGVCDKLKLNALSKNCLLALAENGRYSLIKNVASSYSTIMAAHRGEVVCEVTTAKKLNPELTKEIEGTIGKFLKAGQKSLISYKEDASILGGMIVSIGDKYIDMSIQSKIKKYSELIKAAA